MALKNTKVINYKGEDVELDPMEHASTYTEYGVGTTAKYGHVKLSDSSNGSLGVSCGVAVTPKALADAATSAANMSNVTEGILKVSYGGTGVSSRTVNAVLLGNGANAIEQVASAAGAFYSTGTNEVPKYGTLPVDKGGTGNTSITANAVVLGNAGNALKSVASASGAFYSTGANTLPKYGTLPIAQGGTGATSFTKNCLVGVNSTADALTSVNPATLSVSYAATAGSANAVAAGNISGIVGVAHGGTGVSSFTANALLQGNGTGAVKTVAASTLSVSYATNAGTAGDSKGLKVCTCNITNSTSNIFSVETCYCSDSGGYCCCWLRACAKCSTWFIVDVCISVCICCSATGGATNCYNCIILYNGGIGCFWGGTYAGPFTGYRDFASWCSTSSYCCRAICCTGYVKYVTIS